LRHSPFPATTGTANPAGRVDANFGQLRHALADDLPRHAGGARNCGDATASNRRTFRSRHQTAGALIQNLAQGGEALRDCGEVYHPHQDTPKHLNMEMLFCYEP